MNNVSRRLSYHAAHAFYFWCLLIVAFLVGSAPGVAESTRILSEFGNDVHERAPHGRGNVYASEIVVADGVWHLFYGAQGKDGHDRICLATSPDGRAWTRHGVVFFVEGINHVNDPSIVLVDGVWKMFYTRADVGVTDSIGLAESTDGHKWTDRGTVFYAGKAGEWNSLLVGRPSVLFEGGEYRMWYDGRKDLSPGAPDATAPKKRGSKRSVGYAESKDGRTWSRHPRPVMNRDSGGVHVSRVGDKLVMLIESRRGTLWATSNNGIKWQHHGALAANSESISPHGHVTPFLFTRGNQCTLFFGAAKGEKWNENRIAARPIELPNDLIQAKLANDSQPRRSSTGTTTAKVPLFNRAPASETPENRPNIVMIFTDDQRYDAVGYAGNPAITTPNLDTLARRGVVFKHCFVNTSICAVSRANLLSGQYPDRHGIRDFFECFTEQQLRATVPGRLRDAGYQTAFFGKWGIGDTPDKTHQGAAVFDYWAGQPKQTNYFHERDCRYVHYDGFSRSANDLCDCPADKRGQAGIQVRIGKDTLTDPVHHDAVILPDHARRFLDGRDKDKPFCMMLFFKSPHGPFGDWDPQTQHYTDGKTMPIPPAATSENARREPDVVKKSLGWSAGQNLLNNPQRHRGTVRDYYRSISSMDLGVGRIMKALRERGLDKNTVVLFTSDNGHFSGEHGLGGKWLMYEPSLRVPGFICDLRKPSPGTTSDAMIITTDFSVTMLALAGLPIPKSMTGRDLMSLAGDAPPQWREELFYDHPYAHGGNIPTTIGVRTRTHTYTRYTSEDPPLEQLFDNRADPDQLINLAANPAFADLLAKLRDRCGQLQKHVQ